MNVKDGLITLSETKIVDNYKLSGSFYNYFPNSSFECYLRGFSSVDVSNTTISQETGTVRSGASALRVTATAAASNYCYIDFADLRESTLLRNKTLRFSAWVYVPAIYTNDLSRASRPLVVLYSADAAANIVRSSLDRGMLIAGQWNFFSRTVTIQNDATIVGLIVSPNYTGTATTTDYYIIVDDITVTDATINMDRLVNTTLPEYSGMSSHSSGGNMIMRMASAPTDVDQTYAVGDIVWKTTPTTGAAPGWVCTTGGAGGTAVFTEMGNLD